MGFRKWATLNSTQRNTMSTMTTNDFSTHLHIILETIMPLLCNIFVFRIKLTKIRSISWDRQRKGGPQPYVYAYDIIGEIKCDRRMEVERMLTVSKVNGMDDMQECVSVDGSSYMHIMKSVRCRHGSFQPLVWLQPLSDRSAFQLGCSSEMDFWVAENRWKLVRNHFVLKNCAGGKPNIPSAMIERCAGGICYSFDFLFDVYCAVLPLQIRR